jgi:NitT/TauT family transport system substrate-binding protein
LVRPPFTINAAPSVKSISGLRGKKVGTSSPTDSTTVVTQDALSRLGLKSSDYQDVTAGGTSARLAGLEGHALDASLMLPPINATAEKEGFHSLGYVPDLVGRTYKFGFSAVVVNPDWAKKNKPALEAYLAARNDALRFLADPANRQESVSILAEETKCSPEVADQIYDMLHIGTPQSAFAPQIGIDLDAVKGTLSALQAMGQAPTSMSPDELVDDSYAADARGQ